MNVSIVFGVVFFASVVWLIVSFGTWASSVDEQLAELKGNFAELEDGFAKLETGMEKLEASVEKLEASVEALESK